MDTGRNRRCTLDFYIAHWGTGLGSSCLTIARLMLRYQIGYGLLNELSNHWCCPFGAVVDFQHAELSITSL